MFEAGKARLLKIYDDQAAAAYSKVVLEHSASAHVEDAKDRLVAMGLPIPTPTPEQIAASVALENSRGQYTLSNRVEFFVLHKADTVPAATVGEPPLEDAKPTLAPDVYKKSMSDYYSSMNPAAFPPRPHCGSCPARSLRHRLVCRTGSCRLRRAAHASGRAHRRRWRGTGAPPPWSPACRKSTPATASSGTSWASRSCSPPPLPLRQALRPPRLRSFPALKPPRPRSPRPSAAQPSRAPTTTEE